MQRQSLGSPVVSKLPSHGGGTAKDDTLMAAMPDDDDRKPKDLHSRCDHPHEYCKAMKPSRRFSSSSSSSSTSSPPKPQKFLHFIPLLTLLCFLILYLVSHTPSPSDLAQFNRFKRYSKDIDSSQIRDVDALTDLHRGDVLSIRNLKNLQDIGNPKSRSHRKIADF